MSRLGPLATRCLHTAPKTKSTRIPFDKINHKKLESLHNIRPSPGYQFPVPMAPFTPSSSFFPRIEIMKTAFGIECEYHRRPIVTEVLAEAVVRYQPKIKIFPHKHVAIDTLEGHCDYVISTFDPIIGTLHNPVLVVQEASQDFYWGQGHAQAKIMAQLFCYVSQGLMDPTCAFGILTSGDAWQAFQLLDGGQVDSSRPYFLKENINDVLAMVNGLLEKSVESIPNLS